MQGELRKLVPVVVMGLVAGSCADTPAHSVLSPEAALAISGAAPINVATITITPRVDTIAAGDSVQLVATGYGPRGKAKTGVVFLYAVNKPAVATVSATGVVTGVAEGQARITVSYGSVAEYARIVVTAPTASPPPPPPPPPPAPPASGPYTYCTPAGANCDFIGLRDVRLVAANGAFVSQVAYHTVPCAPYGFNNQNPAPGQSLFCDYGPLKTTTMNNPMPGMSGLPALVTVPLGSPGVATTMLRSAYGAPASTPGQGSFRTTCSLATYRFDDPIVYPGQSGASHLHMFFGNTGITAMSTPQSLAGSGNSTCRGGTLNRSAYWIPALFDTRTGAAVPTDEATVYYKTGYNMPPSSMQTIPEGLRMIAGNKSATSIQPYTEWVCRNTYVQNTGAIPTTCPVGDAVRLIVTFPQCWDGVNLDSPDHMSHMAYPIYRNPPQSSGCPSTHPVALPAITEHFDFPVTNAGDAAYWRLSSDMYSLSTRGGYSAHADWMNGWDKATIATIVTQCLRGAKDCGVGGIGNGMELY